MWLNSIAEGGQSRTTIAYLANSFPEPLESYVWEEVRELQKHNACAIACAMRRPVSPAAISRPSDLETLYVFPLHLGRSVRASWLCLRHLFLIAEFAWRAFQGPELLSSRIRALAHTWLGVYFATRLERRNICHIHVHHGYFSAWVGMVAARILGVGFSMTLHGSDLLVRPRFLDIKLWQCQFCVTVSEFNRQFILARYPSVDPRKLLVQRLGIEPGQWRNETVEPRGGGFCILVVGRLHAVKNHGFLLRACRALKASGVRFQCFIAGEGEERKSLERLIAEMEIQREVTLLGHIPRERLPELYARANAVVLTSHSEGLPVTLMEAMAMKRIVIAPRITGMAELVIPAQTGFLYEPDSLEDFLAKLQLVIWGGRSLEDMRKAARRHIEERFNAAVNLANFAAQFLTRVNRTAQAVDFQQEEAHENPVLQQI